MAHLKIEMLDTVNLKLTCVYQRGLQELGTKRTWFKSVVEKTTLAPHDVEHVIHGLGFDESEEDGILDLAWDMFDVNEMYETLDPDRKLIFWEWQAKIELYIYIYKDIDITEWVELLKQPRNCRVVLFENKIKVLYV